MALVYFFFFSGAVRKKCFKCWIDIRVNRIRKCKKKSKVKLINHTVPDNICRICVDITNTYTEYVSLTEVIDKDNNCHPPPPSPPTPSYPIALLSSCCFACNKTSGTLSWQGGWGPMSHVMKTEWQVTYLTQGVTVVIRRLSETNPADVLTSRPQQLKRERREDQTIRATKTAAGSLRQTGLFFLGRSRSSLFFFTPTQWSTSRLWVAPVPTSVWTKQELNSVRDYLNVTNVTKCFTASKEKCKNTNTRPKQTTIQQQHQKENETDWLIKDYWLNILQYRQGRG